MNSNPYSAPGSDPFGSSNLSSGEGISDGVLRHLRGTKGWVKLIAILCFLGAGLMLLGGLAVVAIGIFGGSALASAAGTEGALAGIGGVIGMGVLGAVYAVFGLIYLYPGFKLWGYAEGIEALLKDRSSVSLEKALNEQRRFWKFVGILAVIMICLYILIFLGMIIFGVIMGGAVAGAAGGAGV